MLLTDLLFAFIVAGVLSLLLGIALRRRVPEPETTWGSILFLFLLLFFATWAGGVWLTPFGPPLWNTYWLPFVAVGVLLALMLVAVMPGVYFGRKGIREARREVEIAEVFGAFFWVLMAILIFVVIAHYFR
jgi:hypothetical protein